MASLIKKPEESVQVYVHKLVRARPSLEECSVLEKSHLLHSIQSKLRIYQISQRAVFFSKCLDDPFWYECMENIRSSIVGLNVPLCLWNMGQFRFRINIGPAKWKNENGLMNPVWEQPLYYLGRFSNVKSKSDFDKFFTRELDKSKNYFSILGSKKLQDCHFLINVIISIDHIVNED